MKKILVVIDMQNDFISGALGNDQCLACVPEVVSRIKDESYDQIFLTRDTHFEDYMDTMEGQKLPVPHCIKGSQGWQLIPEVTEAIQGRNYQIVDKPTFGSTELGALLGAEYNTEEIEIDFVGVCTGICVISNSMIAKANCPNAVIRVFSKACACVTPDTHQTALDAMKLCHIDIV